MTTGPWTAHTQGLTPRDEKLAAAYVRHTLAVITAMAEERALGGWLLLGGSLARGEAAVDLAAEDGRLISDFDLFAVAPESERAGYVEAVSAAGAALPGTQLTVFHVLPEGATRLGSYFGQDAVLGMDHIVYGSGPAPRLAARPLNTRSDIEVIVHQASNLLLLDEIGQAIAARRSQRRALGIKLLLETCRVVARRQGVVSRLQDAVASARTCGLSGEVMLRVLLERNTGRSCDMDVEALLPGVVREALTSLGNGPLHGHRLAGLVAGGPSVMGAYQLLILCWLMRTPLPVRDLEQLARSAIVPAEAHAIEDILGADVNGTCWGSSCVEAVLALRRAYYARLGPHNFGNEVMEGYDYVW